jgi:hypothetical protein
MMESNCNHQSATNPMMMNGTQVALFNHQISIYKHMIRNQSIPDQHLMAIRRSQQQFYPPNPILQKSSSSNTSMIDPRYSSTAKPLVNNGPVTPRFSSSTQHNTQPATSVTNHESVGNTNVAAPVSRSAHQRVTSFSKPVGLDVHEMIKQRDQTIQSHVSHRINDLETYLAQSTQSNNHTQLIIELKALKLLNFQRQVSDQTFMPARQPFAIPLASVRNCQQYASQFDVGNGRSSKDIQTSETIRFA